MPAGPYGTGRAAAAVYIAGILRLVDPDCKTLCRRKFCHVHFIQQLCQRSVIPQLSCSRKCRLFHDAGNNPVLGGGSLGVSKYCKRPKDALSFIKWMCSEPLCSASALLGSTSPCRRTYDNYEVLHNYPWLKLSRHCFPISKGNRLPAELSVPFDERKFLSILGLAVKNAYTGIVTPKRGSFRCPDAVFKLFQNSFRKTLRNSQILVRVL